jgi:hypothetical protein
MRDKLTCFHAAAQTLGVKIIIGNSNLIRGSDVMEVDKRAYTARKMICKSY